mgnify:CR=1 FL=1
MLVDSILLGLGKGQISFLTNTGVRLGEAAGLRWKHLGLRLLAIGEKIIKTFEDKEVLDSKDIDLFLAIPNSIKAIGALGASGSDLAADGLLIRQLMEKLKEAEN